jgi:hypothetical protein
MNIEKLEKKGVNKRVNKRVKIKKGERVKQKKEGGKRV